MLKRFAIFYMASLFIIILGCGYSAQTDPSTEPFAEETTDEELQSRSGDINGILVATIQALNEKDYETADRELKKIEPIQDRMGNWSVFIQSAREEIDEALASASDSR